jgi:hypothetical protein
MITLPITEQAKQQEWNLILTIARNKGFPLQIIHNPKNKLMLKLQQTKVTTTQKQRKKNLLISQSNYTQGNQFI